MHTTADDTRFGVERDQEHLRSHNSSSVNRREFLKAAVATGVLAGTLQGWAAETESGMPHRRLGRTGEKVSAIGLGGYHIGVPKDEQEGIRLIRSAIDRGITFHGQLLGLP